jgi:hypothetical protein
MKHQFHPAASRLDGLPIPDITPDLLNAHFRKIWVVPAGHTAHGIAAGNQTFDNRAAEKAAAAGYQNLGSGKCLVVFCWIHFILFFFQPK